MQNIPNPTKILNDKRVIQPVVYAKLYRRRLCHFVGGMAFTTQHGSNIVSIVSRRCVDDDEGNNRHHKQHWDRGENAICEEAEHAKIQKSPSPLTERGGVRSASEFEIKSDSLQQPHPALPKN